MKKSFFAALTILCFSTMAVPQQQDPTAQNSLAAQPQTSSDSSAAQKPDYSKEPFVFDLYTTKIRFENDGTGEREHIARISVQSAAGVQALGELAFGYNSANEQITIKYVRVQKRDGKIITADASAVKEMTPSITRDAPVYTDFKEKRVTVPSLQPGDTLEYDVDTRLATPLAEGEFWYAQNFLKGAIILEETLEVSLPDGRAVKLASPGGDYKTAHENGRVVYTWKHAQLTHPSDDSKNKRAIPRPSRRTSNSPRSKAGPTSPNGTQNSNRVAPIPLPKFVPRSPNSQRARRPNWKKFSRSTITLQKIFAT